MSQEQVTPEQLLGTFVDRAVCMPFSKVQSLRHGSLPGGAPIDESITEACNSLGGFLSAPDAGDEWSSAQLIVDSGGPWWSKARDDFLGLDETGDEGRGQDAMWVLDHLPGAAGAAARLLDEAARDERWTWMLSQPTFLAPGEKRRDPPRITRPDLLVGIEGNRCIIIDLKVTTKSIEFPYSGERKGKLDRAMARFTTQLEDLGFEVDSCWLLVVLVADGKYKAKWKRVIPSDA
jgi:hypothetical protein